MQLPLHRCEAVGSRPQRLYELPLHWVHMLCASCDLSCANSNISSQLILRLEEQLYCFPWNITRSRTEVLRPGADVLVLVKYLQHNRGAQTSNAHVVIVET